MIKNSTTGTVLAVAALLLGTVHASAATVEGLSGSAFVNRGKGFQAASLGEQVKPGDIIMVRDGGEALIVYSDGCQSHVTSGKTVTVGEASPCSLTDSSNLKPGTIGPSTLLIGAGAVAAGVGAAVLLSNKDSKNNPASP
ncbi:MAG: hypothetical protein ABL901_13460 [Hyphomicrobiaceae bacterium]